jgi:hypothetical protein
MKQKTPCGLGQYLRLSVHRDVECKNDGVLLLLLELDRRLETISVRQISTITTNLEHILLVDGADADGADRNLGLSQERE